jgi:hypothetical protein
MQQSPIVTIQKLGSTPQPDLQQFHTVAQQPVTLQSCVMTPQTYVQQMLTAPRGIYTIYSYQVATKSGTPTPFMFSETEGNRETDDGKPSWQEIRRKGKKKE